MNLKMIYYRLKLKMAINFKLKSGTFYSIIDLKHYPRRIGKTTLLAKFVQKDNPSYLIEPTKEMARYCRDTAREVLGRDIPVMSVGELVHLTYSSRGLVNNVRPSSIHLYLDEEVSPEDMLSLLKMGYKVKIYLKAHHFDKDILDYEG